MREIKFRAWDTKCKMMDDDLFLHTGGRVFDRPLRTYDTPHTEITAQDEGRYILMQYTGLKDKTGREIFEGDVVAVEFPGKFNGVVTYNAPCFGIISIKSKAFWEFPPDTEVIGNIWENPELLDGAK